MSIAMFQVCLKHGKYMNAQGCADCTSEASDSLLMTCPELEALRPPTDAIKHDTGKPRMELLSPIALTEISKVLAFGASKYADNNWRQGFKWSRLLGASLRHIMAFLGGQDKDPETGISHLAHAGCCIMFLLEHEATHKDLDDRYKV